MRAGFPPPSGLSDEAVRGLREPRIDLRFPEADDHAGWRTRVATWNAGKAGTWGEPPSGSAGYGVDGKGVGSSGIAIEGTSYGAGHENGDLLADGRAAPC